MAKFKYREVSDATIRDRASQSGGNFEGIFVPGTKLYKPKEGDNSVRIMPPTWKKATHYGFEIFVHDNIGTNRASFICRKNAFGEECEICDAQQEAYQSGDEDESQKLKAKKRVIFYIIDRNNSKEGPQIWNSSWSMDREIAALSINKKTGSILKIVDPDDGYDVDFTRTGQGLKTRYVGLAIARETTPIAIKASRQEEWLDFITENPIPSVLKYADAEHISAVFSGKVEDEDDEDDDDDNRKEKRMATKKIPSEAKIKKMDDDELEELVDELELAVDLEDYSNTKKAAKAVIKALAKKQAEEEDEDDEDDDDEDEKPAKKKKGKSKDDDDDEDEDEEDDEDDEEDPLPKSGKRSSKKAADDDDDDEDEEDEDDEDEEDEDDKPKNRTSKGKTPASTARAKLKEKAAAKNKKKSKK